MAAPIDKTNFLEFSGNYLNCKRLRSYEANEFDKLDTIEYNKFFVEYLVPNRPCIFCPKLTETWKSRTHWVAEDGSPNFDYLRQHFGDAVVPVANCKLEQYSSHPKRDLTLHDYLGYWEAYRDHGYPATEECLYLKDWHFTKAFPKYEAYTTPVYFQSDWLNEFWDTKPDDDYRFVYMGPKGTWTPFHSDVYRSFSWSANICGRKKWIFYPPGCENSLRDRFGQLVYDVTSRDLDDPQKFPNAAKVKGQALEVIQERGQVIFVPSGWHHQVYNLEDTISINHNWLNGCNVDISWQHLLVGLRDVKREIADCQDMDGWEQQCQLILNASAGIDYQTFLQLLKVITERRVTYLQDRVTSPDMHHNPVQSSEELANSLVTAGPVTAARADKDNSKMMETGLQFENLTVNTIPKENLKQCFIKKIGESEANQRVNSTAAAAADDHDDGKGMNQDISNRNAIDTDNNSEVSDSKTIEIWSTEIEAIKTMEANTEDIDISASDSTTTKCDNNSGDSEFKTVETSNNNIKAPKIIHTNTVESNIFASKCTGSAMNCGKMFFDITEVNPNVNIDIEKQEIKAFGTDNGNCDQCEMEKYSHASQSACSNGGDNGKCDEVIIHSQQSIFANSCDKCGEMTTSMLEQPVCGTSSKHLHGASTSLGQETIRKTSEIVCEGVGLQHVEYDLLRVKEVVTEILEDDDYKQLHFDYADSAEYILHLLSKVNL